MVDNLCRKLKNVYVPRKSLLYSTYNKPRSSSIGICIFKSQACLIILFQQNERIENLRGAYIPESDTKTGPRSLLKALGKNNPATIPIIGGFERVIPVIGG